MPVLWADFAGGLRNRLGPPALEQRLDFPQLGPRRPPIGRLFAHLRLPSRAATARGSGRQDRSRNRILLHARAPQHFARDGQTSAGPARAMAEPMRHREALVPTPGTCDRSPSRVRARRLRRAAVGQPPRARCAQPGRPRRDAVQGGPSRLHEGRLQDRLPTPARRLAAQTELRHRGESRPGRAAAAPVSRRRRTLPLRARSLSAQSTRREEGADSRPRSTRPASRSPPSSCM